MRKAESNWDQRRVFFSFPYVWLLVRGWREGGGKFSGGKHPPMDRGHRAKIFAPFDALDGFSAEIRKKNSLLQEAVPETQEKSNCVFPEDW